MSNIDQAEALNMVKNSLFASGSYTPVQAVGNIMGRLMTTQPTASSNGTEVANGGGSSYAAQNVTSALPSAASVTSLPAVTSSSITWSNLPAVGSPGIRAIELWDSAGTPKRKWFGNLAADKIVALGDSLTIPSGQLSITSS